MGADNKIGFIRQPDYHDLVALDFLQLASNGKSEIFANFKIIQLGKEDAEEVLEDSFLRIVTSGSGSNIQYKTQESMEAGANMNSYCFNLSKYLGGYVIFPLIGNTGQAIPGVYSGANGAASGAGSGTFPELTVNYAISITDKPTSSKVDPVSYCIRKIQFSDTKLFLSIKTGFENDFKVFILK